MFVLKCICKVFESFARKNIGKKMGNLAENNGLAIRRGGEVSSR